VRAALIPTDQADGRTDITKVKGAFRDDYKAPENSLLYVLTPCQRKTNKPM